MSHKTVSSTVLIGAAAFAVCAAPRASAQSVKFEAIDGVGARIFADNNRLLVDDGTAGFNLIGSDTNKDDPNNISSIVRNNNGVMRTMNGSPTPYLPYSFTFQRDAQNSNRLFFSTSLGPSAFNLKTVSMPLGGRLERFTHWRYAGATSLQRYDQNPPTYKSSDGQIYIAFAPGSPAWGEAIGPDYTLRVTITKTSWPLSLAFVNAPFLSTGVRDVEFGFGPIGVGQRASASGFIDVYRTDPALFPTLIFQSEAYPYHQIGRPDGDGWSVNKRDTPGRFMNYGPYTLNLADGSHKANYRLMLDEVTKDNARIVTLDVFDANSGRILASRDVTRRQFNQALKYQDFEIAFVAPSNARLEFRTFWHGENSYVRQDRVSVR